VTITLKIEGDLSEIGTIPYKAVSGSGFVVEAKEGLLFVPLTMPQTQAVAQDGFLYKRVKITITLEET
jgi:hypothetical protein